MSKLHIKKGDTVYVLAGEDKGQQGRVLSVQAAKNRAIVEGINIVSKSTKPTAKHPQGGIVKMEAPINISNLALIDPKSGKPPVWESASTKRARKYVTLKNQERRSNNEHHNP